MTIPALPEYSRRERRDMYRAIKLAFGDDSGEILLAWLKREVSYGHQVIVAGDTHLTYWHMGRRDIIDKIVHILDHSLDELVPEPPPAAGNEPSPAVPEGDDMFGADHDHPNHKLN